RVKKSSLSNRKEKNQILSSDRVAHENVIGMLKRCKIISDRYRNRRKRFAFRFNLIAGIYNLELT
ncbi:MAG: IS5/IS1182 family transposase, partial [Chlamydia sp.]